MKEKYNLYGMKSTLKTDESGSFKSMEKGFQYVVYIWEQFISKNQYFLKEIGSKIADKRAKNDPHHFLQAIGMAAQRGDAASICA